MTGRFSFGAALFLTLLSGVCVGISNQLHPLNEHFKRLGLTMALILMIGAGLCLVASGAEV